MPGELPTISGSTYLIENEIGSGGGGVVYKAWHTRLKKHVVIKELKGDSNSDIETQRNEVEALKNVKNSFLPQVYDFLTENDRVFTVIEFIEGESFDKLIERDQEFTQPQIVKWYSQLSSALEAIHKQHVCHRDIKPANIMLMPSGDVCLIDFNAALVKGNDVKLISRSLGYASPEQYRIYERYKNTQSAPIRLDSLITGASPLNDTETELISDDGAAVSHIGENETEILENRMYTDFISDGSNQTEQLIGVNRQSTDMLLENSDTEKTETITQLTTDGIDWKLSDIYSLGATMYHLLTGKRPPERADEVVAVSNLGRFSEGIVYVIEQSMRPEPSERFASVLILSDAVRNIHKHDTRWRISQSKRVAAAIILLIAFMLFTATALYGSSVMAQEKEERYYTAVYDIEHSAFPNMAYDSAIAMFWDRIDPYLAMAKRLWNEGSIDTCRSFIEQNLGNIAQFQSVPEAQRSFGDIYYILGNCYNTHQDEPDYNMAKGNFEIAVRFVTDNPAIYRDYAISLARTGNIVEAEQILEKAKSLNIESDSINLLIGEISFAKHEYDRAIDSLAEVISRSSDDYVRYRAYHTSDEIHKLRGQPERSVALLADAQNRIPLSRVPEMTEKLADAYVKSGDYENAIILFERLSDSGTPKFHIMQGLAILLQNTGEFDRAAIVLNQMADIFPKDFRVPMRQAYLEANMQSKIANEDRDYALAKQYYDIAVRLYNENVKPGESDPEMQQLELSFGQLRANGWIN